MGKLEDLSVFKQQQQEVDFSMMCVEVVVTSKVKTEKDREILRKFGILACPTDYS